ncbi:MAG: immunoglobulin domain-containing protein, partial [Verrucomicrobiota bacterium]
DALPVPVIQWFKDGAAITGAVGSTYTISNMTAGTVGDYFARATNPAGSTDSRTAGITLEEDLRPPLLMTDPVNQPRLLSDGTFVFTFDEDMDPAFLSTPGVHIFPVGGDAVLDNLGIAGFSLVNGTNFVVTSSLPPLSQVPYLLTLSAGAVQDEAGNPNAAVNDQPISGIVNGPVFLSGMVTSEGSIALAFSEEIDLGTIVPAQISIYPGAGDPDADNLGVQGAVAGSNLTELILTTLDPPQPGTPYRARVQAGAASDLDGTPNEAGNLPLRAQYVILPAGTTWAYLDDGSDQGAAWQAPGFDDSTWARGPAPLGYGDGDEATVVDFGGISTQKFITTYYRASVTISHPAEFSALVLRLRRDDGAVVYLNGSEVVRDRMPAAPTPILFDSRAIGGAVNGAQESTFYQFFPDPALLLGGTNVLAVEIHQQSMSSSDTSFDLALLGEGVSLTGSAPQVTHPTPAAQSLAEGGSATFTAAAGGFPSPRIYWEHDDGVGGFVPVAGATNATLVIDPLLPSHSGNYRAVATNYAGVSFSDTASLVVSDDTVAPTLLSARGSDFSVLLTFSRDLGPTAALPGNYALDRVGGGGALTVTNAMLNRSLVTLQHPEKQPQGRYQVTVSNLGDTTENPNVIDPNPTVFAYTSDLEIIAVDASWRALDDGSDQGTAWRNPGFDDSTWIEGPAELGYGDGDEATVLGFGPDDTNKYATTYFRKTFTIDDPTDFTNVTVVLHYDDGAVSYLNGIEVNRVNMTNDLAHPVLFSHYADAANNSDNRYETFSPSPAMLVAGENTLAVEIHQSKATSSDISFSLQLRGQTGEYAPDMILGLPDYSGGDIHLHFDGTGDLYVQETDSLAAPAWTTITAPPGPHTSPLNVGPANGARRYFRVTNSP